MKTKSITSLLVLFSLGIITNIQAQSFKSVYEFTSPAACPVTALAVTAQPTLVTFSNFSEANVNCAATVDVYNHQGWNTTATIDLTEFLEFSVTADDCYRLDLDTLIFSFRNSSATSFPNWHIRSSLDSYAADIKTGGSNNVLRTDTIVLDPVSFAELTNVTFRIYITDIQSNLNTWRIDDFRTFGTVNLFGTLPFYIDDDNDGYGTGVSIQYCSNPGGYTLLSGDCDDSDPLINPNTVWYADIDNDGFGDPLVFETTCFSTLSNATLNGSDCNDTDPLINPATVWYADLDNDGFGDDATSEVGCSSTLTNATIVGGDCNEASAIINPNTLWYEDLDNDGFGNESNTEIVCTSSFAIASMQGGDCDDSNNTVHAGAQEICDGLDNNCDTDIDEDLFMTEYFIDADHDLFGGGSAGVFCSDPGIDYAILGGDCDDDNSFINPNVVEVVGDTIDDNCDGSLLAIDELAFFKLSISPNPGTNELIVSASNLKEQSMKIEIVNLQGQIQLINEFNQNKNQTIINTNDLNTGIYFVQITISGNTKTFKWTKV